MLSLVLLGWLIGQTPSSVTVFVSAPSRDGFVDTDRGLQDSINDVANRLRKAKDVTVVDRREIADVILTVTARGVGSESYGQRLSYRDAYGGADLDSTPIVANTFWVSSVLQVGKYRKEFRGARTQSSAQSLGAWGLCADELVKNLRAWISANHATIVQRRGGA
ncbi:MAG TPA: hypothetical protein VHB78_07765 [Vicinamibacterales bacterium]|jgi:hypothetical protein|nr:hypothetical protein [Vicinamibacterales bacterium]